MEEEPRTAGRQPVVQQLRSLAEPLAPGNLAAPAADSHVVAARKMNAVRTHLLLRQRIVSECKALQARVLAASWI